MQKLLIENNVFFRKNPHQHRNAPWSNIHRMCSCVCIILCTHIIHDRQIDFILCIQIGTFVFCQPCIRIRMLSYVCSVQCTVHTKLYELKYCTNTPQTILYCISSDHGSYRVNVVITFVDVLAACGCVCLLVHCFLSCFIKRWKIAHTFRIRE